MSDFLSKFRGKAGTASQVLLIGRSRHLGYAFIAMQGALLALLTMFFLNQAYLEAWRDYPASGQSTTLYLKNIPEGQQAEVERYLLTAADERGLFIVRRDSGLASDGSFNGFKVGVYGNAAGGRAGLDFLGQTVLEPDNLGRLLASSNPKSTLGVDTGSADSLEALPHFRPFEQVVVKQLPQLISDSDTVDGTYHVVNLSTEVERSAFMEGLVLASGLSEAELLWETSGGIQDTDFKRDILFVFLGAQVFSNMVFFLVVAVRSLDRQGKLTLLGWSRSACAKKALGPFLYAALVVVPFAAIGGWLLAGWGGVSLTLFSFFVLSAATNVLLVGVEMALAFAIIMLVKPLDAIRGRIPKRPLYAFGIFAYLLVSAGAVFCGYYVDGPTEMLSENAKLSQRWHDVSDYRVLSGIAVGQDAESFTGQSGQLNQDIYDWYSSIAQDDGVFLVNTQYHDRELLDSWSASGVYDVLPTDPFWLFTLSPNYLAQLGMEIGQQELDEAKAGTRLYLLPSTLSAQESEQMMEWIKESSTRSLSPGDIQTEFTKNPQFAFVSYEPSQDFFTWATSSEGSMAERDPVIYVATPENMRYFETESLRAVGFDGYLKFVDASAMDRHTQASVLAQFNLSDNELTFLPVQDYIDGLQKGIILALLWFGGTLLVLVLVLIGLLLTLATIFRIANQEMLQVKKFLGFSFWQMYRGPLLLLMAVTLLELAAALLLRSRLDLLLVGAIALAQGLIFWKYMARNELKRLLLSLKEA
jgi:hypothetical protein